MAQNVNETVLIKYYKFSQNILIFSCCTICPLYAEVQTFGHLVFTVYVPQCC